MHGLIANNAEVGGTQVRVGFFMNNFFDMMCH